MIAQKPPETKAFLDSFDDAGVFNCGDFNLLKVAQDAVLRKVGSGNNRTYFDKPPVFIKLLFSFKQIFRNKISISPSRSNLTILAAVPSRTIAVPGSSEQNQFLGRILEYIPANKVHFLSMANDAGKSALPDVTNHQIMHSFEYARFAYWELQFLKDMNSCFLRLKAETRFDEESLRHIRTGFDEFWRKYRAFRKYLSNFEFTKALLIPGYHSEHAIAAMQSLGVEVIELQHGVITTASHFYCYPEKIKPVSHKALFANQVWLFGAFWKQELLKGFEYDASQLHVLGDYFFRPTHPPSGLKSLEAFEQRFKTRILIGTQKKRHEVFNDLISTLSEKYTSRMPDVGLVIKLHPAESTDLYSSLSHLPNVLLAEASLDFLYPRCHVYISMYSNTLFEATRVSKLKKFVLESPETIDFVNGVVSTGVAIRLEPGDDPLEMSHDTVNAPPEAFFQPEINKNLLESLIVSAEKQ